MNVALEFTCIWMIREYVRIQKTNCGLSSRDINIRDLYRRRENGGFQYFPQVVVPRTSTPKGGEGGRVQERTVSIA